MGFFFISRKCTCCLQLFCFGFSLSVLDYFFPREAPLVQKEPRSRNIVVSPQKSKDEGKPEEEHQPWYVEIVHWQNDANARSALH